MNLCEDFLGSVLRVLWRLLTYHHLKISFIMLLVDDGIRYKSDNKKDGMS